MMYKTHKAGGALVMLISFEVMREHNMLIPDVNDFIQLAMMYPAASWGSTFPDLDHGISSVKEKTPFNMLCHKIIHLSHPVHRSWQTHSVYFTCSVCLLLLSLLNFGNYLGYSGIEWVYIRLVTVGAVVGVFSHLLLDMLSMAGIWFLPSTKIRFVPKDKKFGTGSPWEDKVCKVIMFFVILLFLNLLTVVCFNVNILVLIFHQITSFVSSLISKG